MRTQRRSRSHIPLAEAHILSALESLAVYRELVQSAEERLQRALTVFQFELCEDGRVRPDPRYWEDPPTSQNQRTV